MEGLTRALYLYGLVSNEEWLHIAERASWYYYELGDLAWSTSAFHSYANSMPDLILNKLGHLHNRLELEEYIASSNSVQAGNAWLALTTLLASRRVFTKASIGEGELLPSSYASLASLSAVLEAFASKLEAAGSPNEEQIALEVLNALDRYDVERALVALWWFDLVTLEPPWLTPLTFTFKVVVVQPNIIVQVLQAYGRELEALVEDNVKFHSPRLMLTPKRNRYGASALDLAMLTLLSVISHQYRAVFTPKPPVTPADTLIAALRLTRKRKDTAISVHDIAEEIASFWLESRLIHLFNYNYNYKVTPEEIRRSRSLAASLSLLSRNLWGIAVTADRSPTLFLPPQGFGFNYVHIYALDHVAGSLRTMLQ